MKVLTICNWFPPRYVGGAEVSAFYTVHGLRRRSIDASVLSVCRKFPVSFDHRHEFKGVPIHEVGLQPRGGPALQLFDPEAYRIVLAELQRERPQLVHIHNVSGASLAPFLACRRLRIPVVLTLHDHWLLCVANTLYRENGDLCSNTSHWRCCGRCYGRYDYWANVPLRRRLFSWATRSVRRLITPSRRLMDLHVASGYDASRFRVIPYGISADLSLGTDDGQAGKVAHRVRRLLAAGPAPVLMFSGVLVETKGIDTLVAAVPLIVKHLGPIQLWVAGAGEGRYAERLAGLDCASVEMFGKLAFDVVREVYGAAGLTVVPSVWFDNSPVVIYESLLAGTPVLGSDLGGIPELIRHNVTGYVVKHGDPHDLAANVLRHFSLPALERRRMRRECQAYAKDQLGLDRHLDAIIAEYEAVLA
jgi:glycosyltransferase involved in cell wall biosynthesis